MFCVEFFCHKKDQKEGVMPGLHQPNSRCFTAAFLTAALESGRCESILLFLSSIFFCSRFQSRKKGSMYFWCELIEL